VAAGALPPPSGHTLVSSFLGRGGEEKLAYPVCHVVDGFGDGTMAGVIEGHGWAGGGGVFFEPAVECEHVFHEFRCVALAPLMMKSGSWRKGCT
jgi:hypothetical protein